VSRIVWVALSVDEAMVVAVAATAEMAKAAAQADSGEGAPIKWIERGIDHYSSERDGYGYQVRAFEVTES
jgi:hypothetical protein